eukprot:TRINITY_DN1694_c0_g1_i2.p1 TRINITY_DN1694_c0_g1~~TRINITY_DN1694_c0_g1_i2.p1  ORF type:complete len:443 (-),score=90.40 TRINITY_DN1694_c0_g1_i2:40-1368(-)
MSVLFAVAECGRIFTAFHSRTVETEPDLTEQTQIQAPPQTLAQTSQEPTTEPATQQDTQDTQDTQPSAPGADNTPHHEEQHVEQNVEQHEEHAAASECTVQQNTELGQVMSKKQISQPKFIVRKFGSAKLSCEQTIDALTDIMELSKEEGVHFFNFIGARMGDYVSFSQFTRGVSDLFALKKKKKRGDKSNISWKALSDLSELYITIAGSFDRGITLATFYKGLHMMDSQATLNDAITIFRNLDVDSSETITFTEFIEGIISIGSVDLSRAPSTITPGTVTSTRSQGKGIIFPSPVGSKMKDSEYSISIGLPIDKPQQRSPIQFRKNVAIATTANDFQNLLQQKVGLPPLVSPSAAVHPERFPSAEHQAEERQKERERRAAEERERGVRAAVCSVTAPALLPRMDNRRALIRALPVAARQGSNTEHYGNSSNPAHSDSHRGW